MSNLKTGGMVAVLTLLCMPAWAINKCTSPDGRTVFQDIPCEGKGQSVMVKPASGSSPAGPVAKDNEESPTSGAPAKPMTNAQRIDAQVTASVKERRRRDLETIEVPQAAAAVDKHRRACEQAQARLAAGQYTYVQNLYGKTHAAQVASEIAATAARCDTEDRELKERLDATRKECTLLGGCR